MSQLPPSHEALRQDVQLPQILRGFGFLSRMKMSPCSPFFHSQIPRGLLRKLSENWAGKCHPLGTDSHLDLWERRHLSGGISLRQHGAGSACHRDRPPVPGLWKENPKEPYWGGKGFWLSSGSPIQHTGTKALHRACRCCREEEGRRGGDEGWKIKQKETRERVGRTMGVA